MEEGQWLANYRLQRPLGAGGSSTVWLAIDEAGTQVALKLLHPMQASTAQARARLSREATTVNQVHSHGVAHVVDLEVDGVQPFIVSEFIEGPTLAHRIAEGVLNPREIAAIAESLRVTLDAVHRAGVVHRDIKPSNIILHTSGPILIDFGIAMSKGDERITDVGMVSGTLGFTAPELIRGHAASKDTDMWALAATLLNASTGRPPYGGGDMAAVMLRVCNGQADLQGLPPRVAAAFSKCLAPTVADRGSADYLLSVLDDPQSWTVPDGSDASASVTMYGDQGIRPPIFPPTRRMPGDTATQTVGATAPSISRVDQNPSHYYPYQQRNAFAENDEFAQSLYPLAGQNTFSPTSGDQSQLVDIDRYNWGQRNGKIEWQTWILSFFGVVLLSFLPVFLGVTGIIIVCVIGLLVSTLGEFGLWRFRRRVRAAGVRASDTPAALLALPLHVCRAVLLAIPSFLAATITAYAAWFVFKSIFHLNILFNGSSTALPFDDIHIPSQEYSIRPLPFVTWVICVIFFAIIWSFPTTKAARAGAGIVVYTLLKSRGLQVIAIVFLALAIVLVGGFIFIDSR